MVLGAGGRVLLQLQPSVAVVAYTRCAAGPQIDPIPPFTLLSSLDKPPASREGRRCTASVSKLCSCLSPWQGSTHTHPTLSRVATLHDWVLFNPCSCEHKQFGQRRPTPQIDDATTGRRRIHDEPEWVRTVHGTWTRFESCE